MQVIQDDFLVFPPFLSVQVNVICSGSEGHAPCTNTMQLYANHTFTSVALHTGHLVVWLAFLFLQVKILQVKPLRLPKEADL